MITKMLSNKGEEKERMRIDERIGESNVHG